MNTLSFFKCMTSLKEYYYELFVKFIIYMITSALSASFTTFMNIKVNFNKQFIIVSLEFKFTFEKIYLM